MHLLRFDHGLTMTYHGFNHNMTSKQTKYTCFVPHWEKK